MRRRFSFFWFALVGFLLLTGARAVASFVVDGLWFSDLDLQDVFVTTVIAQVTAALSGGLLAGAAVLASGRIALSYTRNRPVVLSPDWRGTLVDAWLRAPGALPRAVQNAAVLAALLAGSITLGWWDELLAWWFHAPFGQADPILDLDASFYIFTLPVLEMLRLLLLVCAALALAVGVGVYVVRGALSVTIPDQRGEPGPPELRLDPGPRRHLAVLGFLVTLLVAVGFQLDRFDVLASRGALFDGPGYTDVNVVLPLLTAQAVAMLLAAFIVFQALDRLRLGSLFLAIVLVSVASLARAFVPGLVQQFVVLPNELDKEQTYIAAHVHATRTAWGLDGVEERALTGRAQLSWDDVQANRVTIDSIRLWDHTPLLETFRQVQEIRTYYEFSHVDNDRYVIDGQLRQTMLSPRELLSRSLPAQARTWVNESLVYTHGYGVALGPVNVVTEDGLPLLWVKDLPPAVEHAEALAIDRPEIYFGEEMPNPVFVRTGAEEFDFPTAEGNATTTYAGKGGMSVGNLARRLVLALHLNDLNIVLSSDLTSGSRVLLYRDVVERVKRLVPFLWIDHDPTMAIVDGRLVWIVEAYSYTDRYPYSAHRLMPGSRGGTWANYVHNSVKAVVDAYDGTVTLYVVDPSDRMLDPWDKAFPGLLRPAEEMPEGVRAHLRYPLALFEVQANLFATYHMTDSQVFYNREDEWEVPAVGDRRMEPYYTVMKLPGEDEAEFILMLPFTPRDKDNLAAWMVGRSDGPHYGTQRVYRFPKDRLVYGPNQVTARIRQNDEISEKLTLWNQESSKAPLGTLLVIPIEESLIYIQPLYLRADTDAIPELKRVIVGYEDRIAMAETLDAGLRALFGGAPPAVAAPEAPQRPPRPQAEDTWHLLSAEARGHYDAAMAASAAGDWAAFGEALKDLGESLTRLESLSGAAGVVVGPQGLEPMQAPATDDAEALPAE